MTGDKILVTGGSGFIGTNIIEYYLKKSIPVINVDIQEPRNRNHLEHWRQVDILDKHALNEVIDSFRPSHIIHMAARTDLDEKYNINGYNANIEGVRNIIKAVNTYKKCKKVIFTSSMLVCEIGYQPKGYEDYKVSTLYGESKVIGEKIVKENENMKSEWIIIRPTSIWGAWFGEPYSELFRLVKWGRFYHPGKKASTRTFGFVGNVVYQIDQLLKAPTERVNKRTFYLGDKPALNLSVWADKIAFEFHNKPNKTIPFFIIMMAAKFGDILSSFGIKFPMTSFRLKNITTDYIIELDDLYNIVKDVPYTTEEGIKTTISWLQENEL